MTVNDRSNDFYIKNEENLEFLKKNRYERVKAIERMRRTNQEIVTLESKIAEAKRNDSRESLLEIKNLDKVIQAKERSVERIEHDLSILDSDYEMTLRSVFGSGYQRRRDKYKPATHIFFHGLTGDREAGIGHGHALLYDDGQVELIREAYAYGHPLRDNDRLRLRNPRSKKTRRPSSKSPEFIYKTPH